MRVRLKTRLLLPVTLAILVAAQPVYALATWRDDVPRLRPEAEIAAASAKDISLPPLGRGLSVLALTAGEDAYEAAGDDTWNDAGVREISAQIGSIALPGVAYVENHTLDKADPELGGDEDWFMFEVGADEDWDYIARGMSVLVEAVSKDPTVYPVVEVFGPPNTPTPVPLDELLPLEGTVPTATAGDTSADWGMWDSWFNRNGASAAVLALPEEPIGAYYIRVRPYYAADHGQPGPYGYNGGAGAYQLRVKIGTGLRIAGKDRFATSVAASSSMFANRSLAGGACVVANGMNFPDALAGSTLAGAVGGPLLLTGPTVLNSAVRAEISRLGVANVYVLGGTTAVSGDVFRKIEDIPGVTAHRVYGPNRYATARAIAKKAYALNSGGPKMGFVASGANFPDALAASPMAAYNVAPILLTRPDRLSGEAESTIRDLGIKDVVIVGGDTAVSSAVQKRLVSLLGGSSHVKRIAGPNRYATSSMFARWAVEADETAPNGSVGTAADPGALGAIYPLQSGVASGLKFPDALAGGTMSGLAFAPLLLLDESNASFDAYVDYLDATGWPQSKSYVFGGPTTLSHQIMSEVDLLSFPMFWDF